MANLCRYPGDLPGVWREKYRCETGQTTQNALLIMQVFISVTGREVTLWLWVIFNGNVWLTFNDLWLAFLTFNSNTQYDLEARTNQTIKFYCLFYTQMFMNMRFGQSAFHFQSIMNRCRFIAEGCCIWVDVRTLFSYPSLVKSSHNQRNIARTDFHFQL